MGVSESEFRACSIWTLWTYPFRIQNALKTLKTHARTSYFPPPFFVKLELCRICMSMPNSICADRQCYPWIILFCAVLRAVICDKSWKWSESFVISSSKHEMCFHVFHPSSLLHFRAHHWWVIKLCSVFLWHLIFIWDTLKMGSCRDRRMDTDKRTDNCILGLGC